MYLGKWRGCVCILQEVQAAFGLGLLHNRKTGGEGIPMGGKWGKSSMHSSISR